MKRHCTKPGGTALGGMPADPAKTPNDLAAALSPMGFVPGDRFELAAIDPKKDKNNIEALQLTFDEAGMAEGSDFVERWNGERNLYFGSNPLKPGRFPRAGAKHVAALRLLALDIDPNDTETVPGAAERLADEICTWCRQWGILPGVLNSGRGRWVLILHEPSADADVDSLRRRFVEAAFRRFKERGASVDKKVQDPSRIIRLPNSINLKTGSQAHLVSAPSGEQVTIEMLRQMVETLEEEVPAPTRPTPNTSAPADAGKVQAALDAIQAEALEYGDWLKVGMALHHWDPEAGFALWDSWSAEDPRYRPDEMPDKWSGFGQRDGPLATIATVFHLAKERGWDPEAWEQQKLESELDAARTLVAALPKKIMGDPEAEDEAEAKGDPGAHLEPDAVAALALLREHDPAAYARVEPDLPSKRLLARAIKKVQSQTAARRPADSSDQYEEASGQLFWKRLTESGVARIKLANFTARIVSDVFIDDGAEQRHVRQVKVTVAGLPPRTVEVNAEAFGSMGWTHKVPGAILEPGQGLKDHTRHAIEVLSGLPAQTSVYGHTGWRKVGGDWVYLHAGGAVGAQGEVEGAAVELADSLRRYVLPAPPDNAKLRQGAQSSLGLLDAAPRRVVLPLLAATYRAAIGETDFSLFMVGTTGSGKSVLSALAQQHYGPELDFDALPGSWESTANALEIMSFKAKDALFVVDDFIPTGSRSKRAEMYGKADRLIRAKANGTGRQRATETAGLRATRYPRATILATGEEIPQGASLAGRMLVLRLQPGDVDWAQVTALQGAGRSGVLASALAGFVRWLAPQVDQVRARVERRASELRGSFEVPGVHARTPGILASLHAGLEILAKFAASVGALADVAGFLESAHQDLLAAGRLQAQTQVDQDQITLFFDALTSALASGRAHLRAPFFAPDACPGRRAWGWDQHSNARGECLGWVQGDDVYLNRKVAGPLAGTVDRAFRLSPAEIGQQLLEQDRLLTVEAARRTYCRLPSRWAQKGARPGVWHVSAEEFGQAADLEVSSGQEAGHAQAPETDEVMSPGQSGQFSGIGGGA